MDYHFGEDCLFAYRGDIIKFFFLIKSYDLTNTEFVVVSAKTRKSSAKGNVTEEEISGNASVEGRSAHTGSS